MDIVICFLLIASALMVIVAIVLQYREERARQDVVREKLARAAARHIRARNAKDQTAMRETKIERDAYLAIYNAFWGDKS